MQHSAILIRRPGMWRTVTVQRRNQRGVDCQLHSPVEGQSVRHDLHTPLIRRIGSSQIEVAELRIGHDSASCFLEDACPTTFNGKAPSSHDPCSCTAQEHTEEVGITVQEVAGRGGQWHIPPEVHFGSATLPSHVVGDETSAVLCVDAPPAKPLRAANRGDTLQVQFFWFSSRRALMCHCLTPEWVGLWGLARVTGCLARTMAVQSAQLAQKAGGLVRTASLKPKPPRDNGIVATSWRSPSTTRMLHKHLTHSTCSLRAPRHSGRAHAAWTSSTNGCGTRELHALPFLL